MEKKNTDEESSWDKVLKRIKISVIFAISFLLN